MRSFRQLPTVIPGALVGLAILAACGTDNTPVVEKVATAKARYWVETIDSDTLNFAYELSSPLLQQRYERDDWIDNVRQAREPYGQPGERTAARATVVPEIPGYPAGEYVEVEFTTEFAGGREALESVLMHLAEDGNWRAVYYQIHPGDEQASRP